MKFVIVKMLSALCLIALSGCGTPQTRLSFPKAPEHLLRPPPELSMMRLKEGAKLSDIEAQKEKEAELTHLVIAQLKALIEWVREQQRLFSTPEETTVAPQ